MREQGRTNRGRPKASVVVCCYNAEKHLSKCLEALKAQTYHNFEIIVVDDGSTDRTSEVAKRHSARLIRIDHRGLPAARNVGVKSAKGDVIAFTDADCVAEPRWLGKLVKELTSGDYAGVIGGTLKVLNSESFVARCLGIRIESEPIKCYAGGYNMAYWKKVIERMNGFDSSFSRGGDYEFYLRASKTHKVAWAKDAVVFFRYPATIKELISKNVRDGAWLRKILKKHPWHFRNIFLERLGSFAITVFPPLTILLTGKVSKRNRGVKHVIGSFVCTYVGILAFNMGFLFPKLQIR